MKNLHIPPNPRGGEEEDQKTVIPVIQSSLLYSTVHTPSSRLDTHLSILFLEFPLLDCEPVLPVYLSTAIILVCLSMCFCRKPSLDLLSPSLLLSFFLSAVDSRRGSTKVSYLA